MKLNHLDRILSQQGFKTVASRFFWRIAYGIPLLGTILKKYILAGSLERRFTYIYKMNFWNNIESASGGGSTKVVTANLKIALPQLIQDLQINSICDAPCGDYSWMREVISDLKIKYTGVDIVPDLIARLKPLENSDVIFKCGDITSFDFNGFDLVLVRDCLFHFSYQEINLFLSNLSTHNYKYLLTTSYYPDSGFKNLDIVTGDFRRIDLLAPPFNFPGDFKSQIADWAEPESRRYLYLWDRNQVPTRLS